MRTLRLVLILVLIVSADMPTNSVAECKEPASAAVTTPDDNARESPRVIVMWFGFGGNKQDDPGNAIYVTAYRLGEGGEGFRALLAKLEATPKESHIFVLPDQRLKPPIIAIGSAVREPYPWDAVSNTIPFCDQPLNNERFKAVCRRRALKVWRAFCVLSVRLEKLSRHDDVAAYDLRSQDAESTHSIRPENDIPPTDATVNDPEFAKSPKTIVTFLGYDGREKRNRGEAAEKAVYYLGSPVGRGSEGFKAVLAEMESLPRGSRIYFCPDIQPFATWWRENHRDKPLDPSRIPNTVPFQKNQAEIDALKAVARKHDFKVCGLWLSVGEGSRERQPFELIVPYETSQNAKTLYPGHEEKR
jgi:hypothetical protein